MCRVWRQSKYGGFTITGYASLPCIHTYVHTCMALLNTQELSSYTFVKFTMYYKINLASVVKLFLKEFQCTLFFTSLIISTHVQRHKDIGICLNDTVYHLDQTYHRIRAPRCRVQMLLCLPLVTSIDSHRSWEPPFTFKCFIPRKTFSQTSTDQTITNG